MVVPRYCLWLPSMKRFQPSWVIPVWGSSSVMWGVISIFPVSWGMSGRSWMAGGYMGLS